MNTTHPHSIPRRTFAKNLAFATAAAVVGRALPAQAEEIKHRLMFFEYGNTPNRLLELDEEGKVVLDYRPPSIAVIFQILPNGNILFAFGGQPTGAMEINRKGEEVWKYISKAPQVLGCTRLPNGNTLLGEQGPCQATEVNPAGEIVHITPLHTTIKEPHLQIRSIHQFANGNIIAAHEGEGAVREVDQSGKIVWEYTGVDNCGDAVRLPSGNTIITCGTQKRVIEVTPDKQIVWEFGPKDAPPDVNLVWVGSVQILKNGNLFLNNFIRGQEGHGPHAFEVTRDKKVVYQYKNYDLVKSMASTRIIEA